MRLTKQLKAQANNLRFASKIPATSQFLTSRNDVIEQDASIDYSMNKEETPLASVLNRTITNNNSNNNTTNNNNLKRKIPMIIMTSHSDQSLNNERVKTSMEHYENSHPLHRDPDEDSLNSNSFQDEQIML